MLKRLFPFFFIFLVWGAFSFPYFLNNRTPFPSTHHINLSSPWAAYERFWQPVKNDAMPDIAGQIYPWKMFSIDSLKKGEIPLWNPFAFSGNPHLANYQSSAFFPLNFIFFTTDFPNAWRIFILIQPLLAGIFMLAFAKSIKISSKGSLMSSVSFMFCGFITVWMGYGTLSYAILFLPLTLWAIENYFQKEKKKHLLLIPISFFFSFLSGHFQVSLFVLGFSVLYVLFKFIQTKNRKAAFLSILFIAFGILLAAPQIFPSIEFYFYAPRSAIFQKIEAIPLSYLPTIISPDFFGNPITRNNFFGHYAEWMPYAGTIPFFLALFSLLKRKNPYIIFFIITAFLSLLLSIDSPILSLIINLKIPILSTSAASRIIVLFSFSIAILSGFGLDILIKELKENKNKQIFLWVLISSLVIATLWIYSATFEAQASIVKRNLIIPSGLFLMLIGSLLISKKIKLYPLFIIALLVLTSFEMLRFAKKWMPYDPLELVFPKTPVTSFYKNISNEFRVLTAIGADNSVYYKIPVVEGYDPLYIKRYGELMQAIDNGKISDPPRYGVDFDNRGKYSKQAIDLLGVKYILHKKGDNGKVWAFPFFSYPKNKFKKIFEDKKYIFYENTTVFPRAFFVQNYLVENNNQKIINTMFAENFNLGKSAVLEENPNINLSSFRGDLEIVNYGNNKVDIQTNSNSEGIFLLSDNYYPGWIAKIDGKETEILRADYTFRAIVVPAGNHQVEFKYSPKSFGYGRYASFMGLAGIASVLLYSKRRSGKK